MWPFDNESKNVLVADLITILRNYFGVEEYKMFSQTIICDKSNISKSAKITKNKTEADVWVYNPCQVRKETVLD